ncbi:sugar ABC transporter substrate-binding protein [Schaalia suimastitidis]|uniref:sugar ABC transporter substrate-binding protein n=1 Tax=Schaalia suimastitidis TaxID=121163 RepID=UPI0003F94B83|nr:maltose ABC transporter substrate-binding protein [Schaalia suimastitidis]
MRRSIAAIGIVALTASLAACGTNKAADTTSTNTATETTTSEVGTLTIWADDTRYTQMQEFATDFTAATGIGLNVVQKSEDDMDDEFITQVPTGNGPDVMVTAHDRLGGLVANGVVGTIDLGTAASELSESAVQGVTYDGQTYGMPYAIESVALIRNNALTTDTPATFDDMIASGKATGAERPFVVQAGTGGQLDPYHMYAFQTSFGAPVFKQEADGSYTTELALGGENGTKFAEWLQAQGEAGTLDTSISADIAKQMFLDGKAPYIVTGPWNISAFTEAGLDIAVLPIPSAGGQEAQPFVGVQAFFPSAKTANPLLVAEFMKYVGSKEGQQKLYELGQRIPAHTAAAQSIDDALLKGVAEVAGSGVPMPAIPEMGSVWEFWGATEGNIATGKEAPEQGWATMVTNIQNAIAK